MIIAIVLFSLTELIGRFHPVLVHLPIGMLVLAAIFQLILLKQNLKLTLHYLKDKKIFGRSKLALKMNLNNAN
jgi:uncharacterized membrane protein